MSDTIVIVTGMGVLLLSLWVAPRVSRWFIRRVHDRATCRVCVQRELEAYHASAEYERAVAEARQRHASRRGTA